MGAEEEPKIEAKIDQNTQRHMVTRDGCHYLREMKFILKEGNYLAIWVADEC